MLSRSYMKVIKCKQPQRISSLPNCPDMAWRLSLGQVNGWSRETDPFGIKLAAYFSSTSSTCSALNSVLEIWFSIAPHHTDLINLLRSVYCAKNYCGFDLKKKNKSSFLNYFLGEMKKKMFDCLFQEDNFVLFYWNRKEWRLTCNHVQARQQVFFLWCRLDNSVILARSEVARSPAICPSSHLIYFVFISLIAVDDGQPRERLFLTLFRPIYRGVGQFQKLGVKLVFKWAVGTWSI